MPIRISVDNIIHYYMYCIGTPYLPILRPCIYITYKPFTCTVRVNLNLSLSNSHVGRNILSFKYKYNVII